MPELRIVLVPFSEPLQPGGDGLGCAAVGAAALERARAAGLDVSIRIERDLDHLLHPPEAVAARIREHRPHVVGFGLYAWNAAAARRVADLLVRGPDRPLIVGGGPSLTQGLREFAESSPAFDVLVTGPGEVAFAELVERLARTGSPEALHGIPGALVRHGGRESFTPPEPVDPSAMPSPFQAGLMPVEPVLMLQLRRGCPMHCAYCDWSGGQTSAPLSAERMASDIGWALDHGYKSVSFLDSAVNLRVSDLKRIREGVRLATAGRQDAADLQLWGHVDYRVLDEARLDLLRAAGFRSGEVGLQSINPRALKTVRRTFDRARFEWAIGRLTAFMDLSVDVMLGLPGDDLEGFSRTVDYVDSLGVSVLANLLYLLPGSELARDRARYGIVTDGGDVEYVVGTATFPPDDMRRAAEYFVTRCRRKSPSSDFSTRNPRFSRFAYNRWVSEDAYRLASERFGDPPPPPPPVAGQAPGAAFRSEVLRRLDEAFGGPVESTPVRVGGSVLTAERTHTDRVEFRLACPGGGAAQVFVSLNRGKPAFVRTGVFDVWYGDDGGVPMAVLGGQLLALADLLRAREGGGAAPRVEAGDEPPPGDTEHRNDDFVDSASYRPPDSVGHVQIGITYACHCRCAHCGVSDQRNRGKLLTVAEITDLCRQARDDLGSRVVELFGGEPMARSDVEDVVEGCAPYLDVWMSSNGVAFTAEKVRRLAAKGLKRIFFSLDSADPARHDENRRFPGAFDRVMKAVEWCGQYGIDANFSVCAMASLVSTHQVETLVDLARRRTETGKVRLVLPKMIGGLAGSESNLLTTADIDRIREILAGDDRAYVESEGNNRGRIEKCFCLRGHVYINPYGVMQPCVYTLMDFGNVREHRLAWLYHRMANHPLFHDKSLLNLCLLQNVDFVKRHFGEISVENPLVKVTF